jgi:cobaltochelatase CobS
MANSIDLAGESTETVRLALRVMIKRNLTDRYISHAAVSVMGDRELRDEVLRNMASGICAPGRLTGPKGILAWARKHADAQGNAPTNMASVPALPGLPETPATDAVSPDVRAELRSIRDRVDAIKDGVVEGFKLAVSVEQVRALVAQEVDLAKVPSETVIHVKAPDGKIKTDKGTVHKCQADLTRAIAAGTHVYLVGPAGTGKTTGAHKAAGMLSLKFYCVSVCSQTTASVLLGYMDAHGKYVRTVFRDAYEKGGVFLLDEIDNGNANVLAVLNAALANGTCAFPDGMVDRHDDFRCIAAGNTWGLGRTMEYVGRNPIDAATLDRFAFIEWPLDESLETKTAALPAWCSFVQRFRAEVTKRGIRHLVTPRATYHGEKLLGQGMPVGRAAEMTLRKALEPSQFDEIVRSCGGLPEVKASNG